jgi:Flp pilus assembly protein TadD
MIHGQSNALQLVLSRSIKAHDKGDLLVAKVGYKKVLAQQPKNCDLLSVLAKLCAQLGQYDEAASYMARVDKLKPQDDIVLSNYAYMQIRQGLLADAHEKLQRAVEINPENFDAYSNLVNVQMAQDDPQSALKSALKAMAINPTSPTASSNLGGVFQRLGDFQSARFAYETALILDPKSQSAKFNLGNLESIAGNSQKAIEIYERVLSESSHTEFHPIARSKFALSFEYLKNGRLIEGWDMFESGFDPTISINVARSPARTFPVPKWKGDDLNGRRLLVWGEQGIGDELIFMTCLPELAMSSGQVLVECEPRLVQTVARSFPRMIVRASAYQLTPGLKPVSVDYDCHIPMGSLMGIYRRKIEDFQQSGPYLVVDIDKALDFESRLPSANTTRKRVGICWRSGKMDPTRNINYTALIDWGSIFSVPNCDFINLQYGECEQELLEAENKFGIRILRWSDLDLKNDIESTLALMSRLDIVVSIDSAVSPMAAAVGLRVVLMGLNGWINLGTNYYPWFPNIQCAFPPQGGVVAECLSEVGKIIAMENITN